jgi:hypothetical protein
LIYLFILIVSISALYIVDSKKNFSNSATFSVILFVCMFNALFAGLQDGVGTDYHSYLGMFEKQEYQKFYIKGEYLYYLFYWIIDLFNGEPQWIFALSSVFNGFFLALTLYFLKRNGYSITFIFFIYFTYTGLYHNQMNGLRQFSAIYVFNFLMVYAALLGFKKALFWVVMFIGVISHRTFLVTLPLFSLYSVFHKDSCKILFPILYGIIIIIIIMLFLPYLVKEFFPFYAQHLTPGGYGSNMSVTKLATKLIITPLLIYFMYVFYSNISFREKFLNSHKGFCVMLFFWGTTSWMYLASLEFGFFYRVSQYFLFANIFPLYYLFKYIVHEKKSELLSFLLILYFLLPYFVKVVLLSRGEYMYHMYGF